VTPAALGKKLPLTAAAAIAADTALFSAGSGETIADTARRLRSAVSGGPIDAKSGSFK
jgi:hypothetical protein